MWPFRTSPQRIFTPEGRQLVIDLLTDAECRAALQRLVISRSRDVDHALVDTFVARTLTPALAPGDAPVTSARSATAVTEVDLSAVDTAAIRRHTTGTLHAYLSAAAVSLVLAAGWH